jgi:hypothetical protein
MQNSPIRTLGDLNAAVAREKHLVTFADHIMRRALLMPEPEPMREKGSVTAIGTTDLGVSAQQAQAFRDFLAPRSAPDAIRNLMIDAPPTTVVQAPTDEEDIAAGWVAEFAPLPLARLSFAQLRTTLTKLGTVVAFHRETLKHGDPRAQNVVLRRVADQVVTGINRVFFGDSAGSASQPEGLLYNVVPVGGGSPASVDTDVERLYAFVMNGRAVRPVFFCSPRGAMYLQGTSLQLFRNVAANGVGDIAGIPQYAAPECAHRLVLVDAAAIGYSDLGLEIEPGPDAPIEMTDTPTPGATTVVSAWQVGATTVRVVRHVSWVRTSDDACGVVEMAFDQSPA